MAGGGTVPRARVLRAALSVSSGAAEPAPGPEGPCGPPAEGSPLRPPAHSCSAVFDEDKPIASSGAYNLDFDSIELVGHARSSECSVQRRSPDAGPPARAALPRSLSLQAGDLDGASCSGDAEAAAPAPEANSLGPGGDCGSLKRTKKPRPPSLKRKPPPKKPPETPPVREAPPAEESPGPGVESGAPETDTASAPPEAPGPASAEEAPPEPAAVPKAACPADAVGTDGAVPPGGGRVQNSPPVGRRAVPPAPAPEAVGVTPAESGAPEDPPARGLSVRLEFDYSEDSVQETAPAKKLGRKPAARMPLRRPKVKKGPEKLDGTPASPPRSPAEPSDVPVAKGSYTFDIDKWDDPNFNPFSPTSKMQGSPQLPPPSYGFAPDACGEPADPCPAPGSPSKSPASFEIPVGAPDGHGVDGDGLSKPAKKKKTPLKT